MTRDELHKLEELRKVLTMESALFHCPSHLFPVYPAGNWPEKYEAFTADVRAETRVWRETWVLPVLDEMIENNK